MAQGNPEGTKLGTQEDKSPHKELSALKNRKATDEAGGQRRRKR